MPNGSKSFWLCPDIIIGTILLKRRASTRTSLFISRGLTGFSEPITTLMCGRNVMAWTAKKFRLTFLGKPLNHLSDGEKRPRSLARLTERRLWVFDRQTRRYSWRCRLHRDTAGSQMIECGSNSSESY